MSGSREYSGSAPQNSNDNDEKKRSFFFRLFPFLDLPSHEKGALIFAFAIAVALVLAIFAGPLGIPVIGGLLDVFASIGTLGSTIPIPFEAGVAAGAVGLATATTAVCYAPQVYAKNQNVAQASTEKFSSPSMDIAEELVKAQQRIREQRKVINEEKTAREDLAQDLESLKNTLRLRDKKIGVMETRLSALESERANVMNTGLGSEWEDAPRASRSSPAGVRQSQQQAASALRGGDDI